jgi:hypothetical protein
VRPHSAQHHAEQGWLIGYWAYPDKRQVLVFANQVVSERILAIRGGFVYGWVRTVVRRSDKPKGSKSNL